MRNPTPAAPQTHIGGNARPIRQRRTGYRYWPLTFILSYLIATYLLFLLWPITWHINDISRWITLSAYVGSCFLAISVGFIIFQRGAAVVRTFTAWRRVIFAGSILSITMLFPLSYLETGRWPTKVLDALQDQKLAYTIFQEQNYYGNVSNVAVSVAEALSSPLTFAVLPLGILYWKRLSPTFRGLVVATILSAVVFSLMRGTDREIANLFIVAGSSVLVAIARDVHRNGASLLRRYWRPIAAIIIFAFVAASVFTDRREGRLGAIDEACAIGTGVCADLESPNRSAWFRRPGKIWPDHVHSECIARLLWPGTRDGEGFSSRH